MPNKHLGPLRGAADFLKASHIKRWGIVNTAKEQSVACHQWRVWMLVHQWGAACQLQPDEQRAAEHWALTHDLAEIRTGDAPTPHKTPEIKAWLAEVERDIYASPELPPHVADLCKACDTAEAILFLKVHGLGQHADDVCRLLEVQMSERLSASALPLESQKIIATLFLEAYRDT